MDVLNVFLNGSLEDEVDMDAPAGLHAPKDIKVCKPVKSLYGQAIT